MSEDIGASRLSKEDIEKVLEYDQETGAFRWKVDLPYRKTKGCPAGSLDRSKGYVRIQIAGYRMRAQCIAWCMVHGSWPTAIVDHIDGNRGNNAISNLRLATNAENGRNRKQLNRNNTSGFRGVTRDQSSRKWMASIRTNRKATTIGRFDTPELAAQAYAKASRIQHGQFGIGENA